ncbi:preprotein translocase, SecE subunit [Xylanimonas cellulosilytica DSM 15894]|uniref:Protein translocase subunit SecE n=1 Tax=Xylanimonas cellulosilytica (strain DSM 15894 / JCM 12276 / CECT 5975 / KCTC 9989 / LMG 20990 / NBRC 107835 / XIL07) TaxID=446471 RepID=D1BWR7_XYLCX|nr:preprotein translocase subunit SecE [Xylanimonas cellulosilytica]ACZ29649.1 preprotein translocase, SecE subunit [Xylanimonas cellulosilytica DSM 15894]
MSESAGAVEARGTSPRKNGERKGLFARIALFVRQVVGELKKVVSPTRQELLTYTGVVLVFVAIVMAFVGLLDYLIGLGVFALFG